MYELNIDLAGELLLSSRTSLDPLSTLVATENDRFTQRLFFLNRTGSAASPVVVAAIPTPYTRVALAGRPQGSLEGDLLFSGTGYVQTGLGADLHYEAVLDLNTVPLQTALVNKPSIPVVIDIELRNEAGTERRTVAKHRLCTIYRDIYRGTEGVPTSGEPVYPSPGAIALRAPTNGNYLINENGVLKLWNSTRALYQPISLTGAAGAETFVIHEP